MRCGDGTPMSRRARLALIRRLQSITALDELAFCGPSATPATRSTPSLGISPPIPCDFSAAKMRRRPVRRDYGDSTTSNSENR
jgi:hypothetical protein